MNNLSSNQNATSTLRLATSDLANMVDSGNGAAAVAGQAESESPEKASSKSLLHAVREGDPEAVKALLAEGADVNAKDGDGWTALMLAIVKGHLDAARALLCEGADVHSKNNRGWTALRFAVSMDDSEAVRLLLEMGADVNDKDDEGNTALMQAAGEKSVESLILLLVNGADTDIKNHAGETALTIAARHGYPEIVQWLNEAGASSNGEIGQTAVAEREELFSEGELQQLIEKIDGLIPLAADDTDISEMQTLDEALETLDAAAPAPGVLDRLVAALEALRPVAQLSAATTAAPPVSITDIAHKLMLSVPEAAAFSGLSRTHLRQAIKEGKLKSRKMGQGWRVKRADLEGYVRKL